MISISKYSKNIARFLVVLMLMQSCIIVKRKSTPEKAAESENTHITIMTKSGEKHKLRWIEQKGENIYSITDTKRISIEKVKLPYWRNSDKLFQIEDKGTYLSALKIIGRDTATVLIPIEEVETIRITAKGHHHPIKYRGLGGF